MRVRGLIWSVGALWLNIWLVNGAGAVEVRQGIVFAEANGHSLRMDIENRRSKKCDRRSCWSMGAAGGRDHEPTIVS